MRSISRGYHSVKIPCRSMSGIGGRSGEEVGRSRIFLRPGCVQTESINSFPQVAAACCGPGTAERPLTGLGSRAELRRFLTISKDEHDCRLLLIGNQMAVTLHHLFSLVSHPAVDDSLVNAGCRAV